VTLYQIARNNKLEGVTLQQIVVGIYQTNPKAFADNNINGLEVGNKLILPSRAYYEDLSHVDATKILKKDNDSWKSIKNKKKEAKPKEPVKEAKPKEPVKEAKPTEPVKEAKPTEPVKELVVKEPSVKIDTKTFKSSISSADDNITEVIIKDKEEEGLTTLHMLLLALLLLAIIGLLIILSRKKRQASILFDENLDQNSSNQMGHEDVSSKSAEPSKPTDRYIASMNKKN
jgi:FimV-like protein